MDEIITLDYGSGGKRTAALIDELIVPALGNAALSELGDGAIVPGDGQLTFSTDSFVVSPLFFPGGDIGKLSVCGTVNDLAMCGGEPKYLSLSLIIEEGLPVSELERVVASIAAAAESARVRVVTGDTKVVERGRGDGLYINTAGIGFLRHPGLSPRAIREGDAVLVSGTVGDHGTAVMLARGDLLQGSVRSDCAPLAGLCEAIHASGARVRCLRDPTRGGLATTLCEFTDGADFGIELREADIPVRDDVRAACEILGLDPLYCANEGKLLAVVPAEDAPAALTAMRGHPLGENAAVIGHVTSAWPGRCVMHTAFGGARVLQRLTGAQLPRIC
jgi:hydrogenase expression/formation protein HypE